MKTYKRQSVFADLTDYDPFAEEHYFIEATQWHNGEGFAVEVQAEEAFKFDLTWFQF